jgi:hypothetical protein
MECVVKTQSIADVIASGDSAKAMQMRGGSFTRSHDLLRTIVRARPRRIEAGQRPLRLAVLHGGGPVPGMNTAVRVALRVAMNAGHTVIGVRDGFRGLLDSSLDEMGWMSVSGWVSEPGAELGTLDFLPDREQVAHIARQLSIHHIDGLLMIGGWAGYEAALALSEATDDTGRPWRPARVQHVHLPGPVAEQDVSALASGTLRRPRGGGSGRRSRYRAAAGPRPGRARDGGDRRGRDRVAYLAAGT